MEHQQEPRPSPIFIAFIVLVAIAIPVLIIATLAFGLTSSGPPKSVGLTINIPPGVGANQSETFEPATVTVVVGVNNTILWTQNDISPHTVTSLQVPGGVGTFDSGPLNKGQEFSVTLTVPGTYLYLCSYHSWMKGTIVVKPA
jgi:plastocyanin